MAMAVIEEMIMMKTAGRSLIMLIAMATAASTEPSILTDICASLTLAEAITMTMTRMTLNLR